MVQQIQAELAAAGDAADAAFLQRYFKTGPGQYGEGDIFRGIRLPVLRKIAAANRNISLQQVALLLSGKYHEERLLALLILVERFRRGNDVERDAVYRLYMANTRFINNWDLVDCSAKHIVGGYLWGQSVEPLYALARSAYLWERRIAVLATFHFIARGSLETSLDIAEMLLSDQEDLIHKGVGWMLREVGKVDLHREEAFLAGHYRQMPRTMLRYAIERFPAEKRQAYLKGLI